METNVADAIDEMIDSLEANPASTFEMPEEETERHESQSETGEEDATSEDGSAEEESAPEEEEQKPKAKPKKKRKDTDLSVELDSLREEYENEKKRRSDTFKEFTATRERNKELERRLEELEKGKKSLTDKPAEVEDEEDDDEAFIAKYKDEIEEDPTEGLLKMIKDLRKQLKTPKLDKMRLYVDEAVFSSQHEDYPEVLKVVLPYLKNRESIEYAEWQEKGGNARAAYEIGLRIKEANEFRKDPEAYKRRWLEEQQPKKAGKPKEEKSITLSDLNSEAPPPRSGKPQGLDDIEEILADALT